MRAKRKKRDLTSSDVMSNTSDSKIYVNERSTQSERLLFSQAKTYARENGFKHCWMYRGRVFIMKEDSGVPTSYPSGLTESGKRPQSSQVRSSSSCDETSIESQK